MTRTQRQRGAAAGGFTLVELLVAMAIFVLVMSSVFLLFAGSVRVLKQGIQNQEAYELARGVFDLVERDLSRAFTSRAHGDVYNFYGTPIGFVAVGMITAEDTPDPNLARVTYVIHRSAGWQPLAAVPDDSDPDLNLERQTYALLRFVETERDDLDSFPVNWAFQQMIDGSGSLADVLIGDPADSSNALSTSAVSRAVNDLICDGDDVDCLTEVEKAAKRELWIRMLAGGDIDNGIPDAWNTLQAFDGLDPLDYVVSENILHIDRLFVNPATGILEVIYPPDTEPPQILDNHIAQLLLGDDDDDLGVDDDPASDYFFSYREFGVQTRLLKDEFGALVLDPFGDPIPIPVLDENGNPVFDVNPVTGERFQVFEKEIAPIELTYWNDTRNIKHARRERKKVLKDGIDQDGDGILNNPEEAFGINLGSPLDARMPVEILLDFTLFFESPYPGAPDFLRTFSQRIDLPTGFRREAQSGTFQLSGN